MCPWSGFRFCVPFPIRDRVTGYYSDLCWAAHCNAHPEALSTMLDLASHIQYAPWDYAQCFCFRVRVAVAHYMPELREMLYKQVMVRSRFAEYIDTAVTLSSAGSKIRQWTHLFSACLKKSIMSIICHSDRIHYSVWRSETFIRQYHRQPWTVLFISFYLTRTILRGVRIICRLPLTSRHVPARFR